MASLSDGVPRSVNVAHYAEIVLRTFAAREELRILTRATEILRADPSTAVNGFPIEIGTALAHIKADVVPATASVSESLPEVLARLADVPAREMVLPDLIALGEIALLHGQPRDGKTWIALDMAISVATGSAAFNISRCQVGAERRVLIIGNEDSERATAERLRLLIAGREFGAIPDGIRLIVGRGASLDDCDWQDRIITEVQQQQVALVIIDPLRSVSAAVDQGPAELKPLATYLRRLRQDTGAAILLVHHDVKPPANGPDTRRRAQKASGGAIFSIVDAPIHAERVDDQRTLLTPDGFKHSADPAPLMVTRELVDGGIRIVGETTSETTAADSALRTKVLEYLATAPGASGRAIARAAHARREDVKDALERLAAAGDVDSLKAGRATRWFLRAAGERQP